MESVLDRHDAVCSFETLTGTFNPDQITSMQTVNGREVFQQLLDISRFVFYLNREVNSNSRIGMSVIHFSNLLLQKWRNIP